MNFESEKKKEATAFAWRLFFLSEQILKCSWMFFL
jgi:hypothetical protein